MISTKKLKSKDPLPNSSQVLSSRLDALLLHRQLIQGLPQPVDGLRQPVLVDLARGSAVPCGPTEVSQLYENPSAKSELQLFPGPMRKIQPVLGKKKRSVQRSNQKAIK